jgi:hypothetical protein
LSAVQLAEAIPNDVFDSLREPGINITSAKVKKTNKGFTCYNLLAIQNK